ncbi:MAG: type II toxin-antitoxin system RelE/ParE family toxin [Nitrospinae bacterium]|nr:type II toxin-antitoxin system RelE/ParE family toxin [Nitrospinota bacterium]
MIKSFADRDTERLFKRQRPRRIPSGIWKRAHNKLLSLHATEDLNSLSSPPGNRLERLEGDRKGLWSVRINSQWRICFQWEEGNAFDVEVCDYH